MPKRKKQKRLEKFIDKLKNDEIDYEPIDEEDSGVNWSSYDKAQVNELKDMLLFVRNSVDEAVERLGFDNDSETGRGRPSYPPEDLAKGVLLQQYFEVSNRVAAGFVDLFKEKLGIGEAYSYKTLERAYDNPHVAMILREVFEMSQEPVEDEEDTFSPDGTGIPNSIKNNWEKEKESEEEADKFTKMVAMIGATYQLISSVKFPDNPQAHESPYFEPLLEETSDRYVQITLVSADSGFLSRDNCDLVEKHGGEPRIYPKKGITLRRKGSWAWTDMLLNFIENPQEWLREYHTRSNVESGFSTFKRHFLSPLRKCIQRRRKTEAFARACDYNLKRASYIRRQEGLAAPWMAA
ncbi:hypothetical protein AKJ61_01285 [candidate division MSBL1 archaeon SCGC-AAA259B11]|uniref:Transposase IS4-like domain-containing protein n=1 Tax=candidate division MSBL1 archaeon SCGC-AAA259B11 TaxID=1698260 RepID=A0A133U7N7_9EURY|nr:hypothetical protein AKJ61_01285 [candidate division MSBL1 archaeon SCGC-AAA259B11]